MSERPIAKPSDEVKSMLKTLDSRLALIEEKIKVIERNQDVLGRTLVVLNQKIANVSSGTQSGNALDDEELETLKAKMETLESTLRLINPLELVTKDELYRMLKKK